MNEFVHENPKVATALQDGFLIMKVNKSEENDNQEFLSHYPDVPGYPHFFIIEHDGTFLHSQGTSELEKGQGYDEDIFLAFLTEWQPNK